MDFQDTTFDSFVSFDGLFAQYSDPWIDPDLHGTGICASGSGTYYLGTSSTDWPGPGPSFFYAEADTWNDAGFPSALCADGSWSQSFIHELAGRQMTCIEPEGFAALVHCWTPQTETTPDESWFHAVVFDGLQWTVAFSLLDDTNPFHNVTLWGTAADDLFFFHADQDSPGDHFDGTELTPVTLPDGEWLFRADGGVKAMAGSRASQASDLGLWVTGTYSLEEVDPWRYRGFVWRSPDGMAWTAVEVPPPPQVECHEYFDDLWISSQDEVFVVGTRHCPSQAEESESIPLLLQFNGVEWTEMDFPPHPLSIGGTRGAFQRIWGFGEELFVAAVIEDLNWLSDTPSFLHYQPE